MKKRKETPVHRYDQVKPKQLNDNTRTVINEFNGGLDGQNMPLQGIDVKHFKDATTTDVIDANNYLIKDFVGASQSYYSKGKFSHYITDEWTPLASIDLQNDQWERGWNDLASSSEFSDLSLQFDAKEGMLCGHFVVDYHRGINRILGVGATVWSGDAWTTQWAVFVNGVMVAETDVIYPKRTTLSIPYKVAVGTQAVDIRLKWRTVNYAYLTATGLVAHSTNLDIFGAEIWCRNVKK